LSPINLRAEGPSISPPWYEDILTLYFVKMFSSIP
jgi:hypothetical protein